MVPGHLTSSKGITLRIRSEPDLVSSSFSFPDLDLNVSIFSSRRNPFWEIVKGMLLLGFYAFSLDVDVLLSIRRCNSPAFRCANRLSISEADSFEHCQCKYFQRLEVDLF